MYLCAMRKKGPTTAMLLLNGTKSVASHRLTLSGPGGEGGSEARMTKSYPESEDGFF